MILKNKMEKYTSKISMIDYSCSISKKDITERKFNVLNYYDTQKDQFINHLISKIPNLYVEIIGLNKNKSLKTEKYNRYKLYYLPYFNNYLTRLFLYNLFVFIKLLAGKSKLILIFISGK